MVIRMRHTRAHTRNRRSHHALKGAKLLKCKKCSEPVLPHIVCANCGTYKGREIIDVLKKLSKKEKKEKELSKK
ncbi:MAG: 50S ribosomal protein L32 [Candidatus Terrybacteria bacterium]|nr:50S ribosomal protein L32 [Candidatus Terrybacteria bacterium]